MNGPTKILIGAVGTCLLAWSNHSIAGAGERFAGLLQDRAQTVLVSGGMDGITVKAARDPALSRTLILSGDKSETDRQTAIAAVRAVPGAGAVRWAGESGASPVMADAAPAGTDAVVATPKAVADCQQTFDTLVASDTITFRAGSAYINPANDAFLDKVADAAETCGGTRIEVAGHTDTTGSAAINRTMSEARAKAVMADLVKRGVPEQRLSAKGYGSDRLKNTADGTAAENRRIEFDVSAAPNAGPATASTTDNGT